MERETDSNILLKDGASEVVRGKGERLRYAYGNTVPHIPRGKVLVTIIGMRGATIESVVDVTHRVDFMRFIPKKKDIFDLTFHGLFLLDFQEAKALRVENPLC